jgi:predicted TIM-barrel fold metal-dependent hydrolase
MTDESRSAAAPNLAVDCHAHVFLRSLAFAEGRRYTPGYDAPIGSYLACLDRHGLTHGVLVQPSFLGSDNSYLLDALAAYPARLRGIAVLPPDVPAAKLAALDRSSIVGLRLNLIGEPAPAFETPAWRRHLADIKTLGWQIEIQAEAARLPGLLPTLLDAGVNIVIDHFGKPNPVMGIGDPGFRYLLTTAETGRVWVKLSGAYRNGAGRTMQDAIGPLRENFGLDRLLWGSDWPHTQFEEQVGYGTARAALDRWLPDVNDRRTVLGVAPAALFRFPS